MASNMNRIVLIFALFISGTVPNAGASTSDWKQYTIDESGFSILLPHKPESRLLPLPPDDGKLRVYQSVEPGIPPSSYSIFVGLPEKKGIFDTASMDAYLASHIKGLVQTAEAGKLQSSVGGG